MTDQVSGLSKYQIWYRNPENRARVLAKNSALKAKDPEAYAKKKREQYFRRHAHYREKWNSWYAIPENKIKNRERVKAHNRTLEGIFKQAKKAARQRGIEWSISESELREFRKKPCYYCGGALPEYGHGLDRMNNDLGYEVGNVLSCCYECNLHRGKTWSVEEMKAAADAVLAVRRKK